MVKLGRTAKSVVGGVTALERSVLKFARQATPLFRASATEDQKCDALGLTRGQHVGTFWEPVYDSIHKLVVPRCGENRLCIRKLERHLWLRQLCDGLPSQKAIALLDVVRDATNQDGAYMPAVTDTCTWTSAFALARTYAECSPTGTLRAASLQPEIRILATAVRALREEGYRIRIVDGEPSTSECEVSLAKNLDALVRDLGGVALAEWLFQQLRPTYDPTFGRYIIVPQLSPYPMGREAPMIPFGYLLNLAAKHAHRFGSPEPKKLERVVALATNFAALFEVQPYNLTQGLFNERSTIIEYLREAAAFDSLFSFTQSNPGNVGKRLLGILEPLEDLGYIRSDFGVPLADLAQIVQGALDAAVQGPSVVAPIDVAQRTGIPADKVAAVLDILSSESANDGFLAPLSTQDSNLHRVPLLKTCVGYLVLDPSVSAPSFFEAVMGVLRREKSRDVDTMVGRHGLENYVRRELFARNCNPASGKYHSQSMGESDCDCAVETSSNVLLFEVKMKALTQKARGADPGPLLVDLGRTLLKGHCQTGRHELALHKDGFLLLDRRMERAGRSVERVALSFHDFGSLHSRDVTMQFLSLMAGAELQTPVPEEQIDRRGIREFEVNSKKLYDQYVLSEKAGLFEPGRYFNCWFLSLDMFDVIARDCEDADTLWETLKTTRHMSNGTRNWFSEYRWLRSAKQQALEAARLSTDTERPPNSQLNLTGEAPAS